MIIDEEKEHALAKIVKGKPSATIVTSDHNVMITKFNVKWNKKAKIEHEEMVNFKDKNCQKKFKDETTNTNKLSAAFNTGDDLNKQTKKFLKCLKRCVHKCFRKVKIRKENLLNMKNSICSGQTLEIKRTRPARKNPKLLKINWLISTLKLYTKTLKKK